MTSPQPAEAPLQYTGERYDESLANALAFYDHYARYEFVRRRFGGRARLLDIGCGLGFSTRFLAEAFGSAVGIDPSAEAVEGARSRTSGDKIRYFTLEQFHQEAARDRFDVVSCLEVIEHTLQQDALLELVRARLLPGGAAVISTPNVVFTTASGDHNPFHVKELALEEFQAVLRRHFPHVQLGSMTQLNGVLVAAYGRATEPVEQVPTSPSRRAEDLQGDQVVTNFIAVCSDQPLEPVPGLLLVDPRCSYTEELKGIIRQQDEFIRARDEAMRSQARMIDERDGLLRQYEARLRQLQDPTQLPLRYRMVDAVNGALRTRAPGVHARLSTGATWVKGRFAKDS